VLKAVEAGIPVIAAAGNGYNKDGKLIDGGKANDHSPARVAEVITVGATTIKDEFAFFSNFGPEVNILAPGDEIISASAEDDNLQEIIAGTSQAA
jgi:subtilisin family serine protease